MVYGFFDYISLLLAYYGNRIWRANTRRDRIRRDKTRRAKARRVSNPAKQLEDRPFKSLGNCMRKLGTEWEPPNRLHLSDKEIIKYRTEFLKSKTRVQF